MRRQLLATILAIACAAPVLAQDRNPFQDFDDRGGLMVPTNPEELRLVSHELWLKFQRTNQRLYNYIRETSEFRAYLFVCKRHDLNLDMPPIINLSMQHLQQILLAHYEEPDYAVLEALEKQAQGALMADLAGDILGFEYGYRISELRRDMADAGTTSQAYCAQIADEYFKKYVALLATANRQAGNSQR